MRKHVSDVLKEELEKRKWSYKTLSLESGLNISSINKIMTGTSRVTEKSSEAFGKAFQMEPYYYLEIQEIWERNSKQENNRRLDAKCIQSSYSSFNSTNAEKVRGDWRNWKTKSGV